MGCFKRGFIGRRQHGICAAFFLYYSKKNPQGILVTNPKLSVPMDKSDIPGFIRSDIFLSESDMKACQLS